MKPMATSIEEPLYTPQQVAEFLGIQRGTMYRFLRGREIGSVKINRTYRVPQSALAAFKAARYVPVRDAKEVDANQ